MNEIYISIDVEADGPIPGPNSMISLGAVAFLIETGAEPIAKFSVNFKSLPEATEDPETAKFWDENIEAYNATIADQADPKQGISNFLYWIVGLMSTYDVKPVLVGFPAGYDFMFLHWYICKFHGASAIFDYSILDVKSYAMALLGKPYLECDKKHLPKVFKTKGKQHTHLAVDDAEEQGKVFMKMLLLNKQLGSDNHKNNYGSS